MYSITVNGLLMGTKPTFKGALALVTMRWHGKTNIQIQKKGVLVWKA